MRLLSRKQAGVWAVFGLILVLAGEEVRATENLGRICGEFTPFDLNSDGIAEIEYLKPAGAEAGNAESVRAVAAKPLVLVLVEARLLEPLSETAKIAPSLEPALDQFVRDLTAGGWRAAWVSAKLYEGERHQDGRILLALRRFLQKVWRTDPHLAGVVLVGSFPDAFLVRTCNWRRKTPLVLNRGKPNEKKFEKPVPYLRTVPEPVATRCDLVLADMDGRWEELYTEPRERLPYVIGVFHNGVPAHGGLCREFERGSVEFEDFFTVNDGGFDVRTVRADRQDANPIQTKPGTSAKAASAEVGIDFRPLDACRDLECSATDRERPNPIARPEIAVSRIDPRGIALRPKRALRGVNAEGLLDAAGKPRTVTFPGPKTVPRWLSVWEQDPTLERGLLIAFFNRDHRFRQGAFADAFRPAAISHGLPNGYGTALKASAHWRDLREKTCRVGPKATLLDLVAWLKQPAILRDFRAHSDPWGSTFGKCDIDALTAAAGGQPWSWSKKGCTLTPSLKDACKGGKADFALYRTLWENRVLPDSASLYLHDGCNGISPAGAANRPYNDPEYGYWQGAAALLFYTHGLALIGRAKVFYDEPRDFYPMLARGAAFGEAWRHYFEVESRAKSVREVGGDIGRKRSYFWSVLGDWTLRLNPAPH